MYTTRSWRMIISTHLCVKCVLHECYNKELIMVLVILYFFDKLVFEKKSISCHSTIPDKLKLQIQRYGVIYVRSSRINTATGTKEWSCVSFCSCCFWYVYGRSVTMPWTVTVSENNSPHWLLQVPPWELLPEQVLKIFSCK